MANLALSGLASGVDTSTIVTQLMAIERQGLTRMQLSQTKLQTRDAGLKDVQSQPSALKSPAQARRSTDLWAAKQPVERTGPTRGGVAVKGGAGSGGATIAVLGLATPAQGTY